MTGFTFHIPGRLPGLNEIIGAGRTNRFVGGKQKKETTQLCGGWIIASRVPIYKVPVQVVFNWIEPDARRDLDNICAGAKFILDALVATGRIPNDTRAWVTSIAHRFPDPDPKQPRIEVTIFPKLLADKAAA